MARALKLAWSVKGKTVPNPAVGALVVSKGEVVGTGATAPCGGPHAEITALRKAGKRALGGTLYVTLEPCCHYGHTPPCTDAIIAAGIERVVAATRDPNPLVNGRGMKVLQKAGIAVDAGLLREEAAAVNEDFFWAITRKRSWITLKLACTLDGRIADERGESKWITGDAARTFAHELRRRNAAVAVGRTTLERDDPKLSVRHLKGFAPARCVFTSGASLPRNSYFYRHAKEVRSIVVIAGGNKKSVVLDSDSGIEYWFTGNKGRSKSLSVFTKMAFENNLTSVLVEGGSELASFFLENGLVNRVYLFFGNKVLGRGKDALLFKKGLRIDKGISLKSIDFLSFGDTFVVTGIPDNCR